jgi:hypothetical protein
MATLFASRARTVWQAHTALRVLWGAALLLLTVTCATAQTLLIVTPASLTFDAQIGGPAQESQTMSVLATHPGSPVMLNYAVTTSTVSGGGWLSATPTSGATPGLETVSVNTAGLAVGTYTGSVTVSSSGVGSHSVSVTLIVVEENEQKPIVVDGSLVGIPDQLAPPCITPYFAAYSSIQPAINSSTTPAGATILVCPANYAEQITINKSLTLQGVTNKVANKGAAVITAPASIAPAHGLFVNYTDNAIGFLHAAAAAQVLVQATDVNIIDIGVDGAGAFTGCSSPSLIGIAYAGGSSGTVKRAAIRNQNIPNGSGGYCGAGAVFGSSVGVGIRGGLAGSLAVGGLTIQDSSVRGFDAWGIWVETTASSIIQENVVTGINGAAAECIQSDFYSGGGQVSNNTVSSCSRGLDFSSLAGPPTTVSGNTAANVAVGMLVASKGANISGNTIAGGGVGIFDITEVLTGGNTFQYNEIWAVETGISFAISNRPGMPETVTQNTINDASVGISGVAGNNVSNNTFLNVTTLTQ